MDRLFETIRKVLLVGIPSTFPDRGGTAQLFWGLLVCFATFGAYMMYAPFIKDSDDTLSQMAQVQVFLTLLSSLALRAAPPDKMTGDLVTVVLFFVPLMAIVLETPAVKYARQGLAITKRLILTPLKRILPAPSKSAIMPTSMIPVRSKTFVDKSLEPAPAAEAGLAVVDQVADYAEAGEDDGKSVALGAEAGEDDGKNVAREGVTEL